MRMVSFTITTAADHLIRTALSKTRVEDPVVCLLEASEEIKVSPQLGRAIIDGADPSRIRELAQAERPSDLQRGRRVLVPAIYPRSQFPRRYLVTLAGIPFVVSPNLAKKLKGGTVDVAERGLLIRDAAGTVVMPQ